MSNTFIQIPDLWPDNKASGLGRALYNIAIHRVSSGKPPQSAADFFHADLNGQKYRLWPVARTTDSAFETAVPGRLSKDLEREAREYPSQRIAMLAIWREPTAPKQDDTIRTWCIPKEVIEQTMREARCRTDGARWDIAIVNKGGRWVWSARGLKIDVDDCFGLWHLHDAEAQYIRHSVPQDTVPRDARPLSFVCAGDCRIKLHNETWTDAIIEGVRLALNRGLPEEQIPWKAQATPFTHSHEVRPGLHVRSVDSGEGAKDKLRKMFDTLNKLGVAAGPLKLEVQDGSDIWTIDLAS